MKSLIICSGGLDSVSMALIEHSKGNYVELIAFNYGQKAVKELQVVKKLAQKYDWKYHIIDINNLSFIFGSNQLTDVSVDVQDNYASSVVVPLRNSLLIQISYIYAVTNGFDYVVLGSHLDDCVQVDGHVAFPDCTIDFFKSLESSYHKGLLPSDKHTKIVSASIQGYHKKDLIQLAYELDKDMLFSSWTCRKNKDKQCGTCQSCRSRKQYFKESGITDETIYEVN